MFGNFEGWLLFKWKEQATWCQLINQKRLKWCSSPLCQAMTCPGNRRDGKYLMNKFEITSIYQILILMNFPSFTTSYIFLALLTISLEFYQSLKKLFLTSFMRMSPVTLTPSFAFTRSFFVFSTTVVFDMRKSSNFDTIFQRILSYSVRYWYPYLWKKR